jgi:hypothetical protein
MPNFWVDSADSVEPPVLPELTAPILLEAPPPTKPKLVELPTKALKVLRDPKAPRLSAKVPNRPMPSKPLAVTTTPLPSWPLLNAPRLLLTKPLAATTTVTLSVVPKAAKVPKARKKLPPNTLLPKLLAKTKPPKLPELKVPNNNKPSNNPPCTLPTTLVSAMLVSVLATELAISATVPVLVMELVILVLPTLASALLTSVTAMLVSATLPPSVELVSSVATVPLASKPTLSKVLPVKFKALVLPPLLVSVLVTDSAVWLASAPTVPRVLKPPASALKPVNNKVLALALAVSMALASAVLLNLSALLATAGTGVLLPSAMLVDSSKQHEKSIFLLF